MSPNYRSNLVDISVLFVHQTDRAILVRETEADEGTWLAKSQCEMSPSEPHRGEPVEITLPEWLAKEKGLI